MKLHWLKIGTEWHTLERIDATPDFKIVRTGPTYHVKSRTTRQWVGGFDTLAEAKSYAEAIG